MKTIDEAIRFLQQGSYEEKVQAITFLFKKGQLAKPAIPYIIQFLLDSHEYYSLRHIQESSKAMELLLLLATTPKIFEKLEKSDSNYTKAAVESAMDIVSTKPKASFLLQTLISEFKNDPRESSRGYKASIIQRICLDKVAFDYYMLQPDRYLREYCIWQILQQSPDQQYILSLLEIWHRDPCSTIQNYALYALKKFGWKHLCRYLSQVISSATPQNILAILAFVEKIELSLAFPIIKNLIKYCDNASCTIQIEITRSLKKIIIAKENTLSHLSQETTKIYHTLIDIYRNSNNIPRSDQEWQNIVQQHIDIHRFSTISPDTPHRISPAFLENLPTPEVPEIVQIIEESIEETKESYNITTAGSVGMDELYPPSPLNLPQNLDTFEAPQQPSPGQTRREKPTAQKIPMPSGEIPPIPEVPEFYRVLRAMEEIPVFENAPVTLGIVLEENTNLPMIPSGTTLPARNETIVTTTLDNQQIADIRVIVGNATEASQNLVLLEIPWDQLPKTLKNLPQIEIQTRLDKEGMLNVIVTNAATREKEWFKANYLELLRENIDKFSLDPAIVAKIHEQRPRTIVDDEYLDLPRKYQSVQQYQEPQRPKFEAILSEDAGRPGPLERFVAQFVWLMKSLQKLCGVWFVIVAQIVDNVVEALTSYISSIFRFWKTSKSLYRSWQRHREGRVVTAIIEDLAIARQSLGRFLYLPGFNIENTHFSNDYQTFPLKLVIEIRGHLDEMKRDLAFLNLEQIQETTQKSIKDFLLSLIPNPLELVTPWKDTLVMLFYVRYSRNQIAEMYSDLITSYNRLCFLLECIHTEETISNYHPLQEYEKKLVARVGKPITIKGDMQQTITQIETILRRLFLLTCKSSVVINPKKWSRFDLVQQTSETTTTQQPQFMLELQRWVRNEITNHLSLKGVSISQQESALWKYEQQQNHQKTWIQQQITHRFL